MKKRIFNLHLYVGLISAVFLVVISVSGAIIAFQNELNRLVHPELTVVTPGPARSWDVVRDRVEEESSGWKLIRFYFPESPNRSTYVRLRSPKTHKIRHVYVNQYTGTVLGRTENVSNWIIKVHDLNVYLMNGKFGNQFVTWATTASLILSISGIFLWLPHRIFNIKPGVPFPRLNGELHLSVGFWSSLAMFLFAVTGLSLHYQTGKLLDLLNKPSTARSMPGDGTSIDGILQTGHDTLPGTTIPRLLLSEKPRDQIFLYQRFPEDKTPAGRSFTTLDPKTGAVLSVGSTRRHAVRPHSSRPVDPRNIHRHTSGLAVANPRLFFVVDARGSCRLGSAHLVDKAPRRSERAKSRVSQTVRGCRRRPEQPPNCGDREENYQWPLSQLTAYS